MSYDDSAHWLRRANEMRARAEQMHDCVTKQVLRQVAEACERLARTPEQPINRFPPSSPFPSSNLFPSSSAPVLPTEARQFAPRKDRVRALPSRGPAVEIPSFLKRGPRAQEDVNLPIGHWKP
jgi:hypothetical protein